MADLTTCRVSLLDVDPQLADALPEDALAAARSLPLPAVDLAPGPLVPEELPVRGELLGLVVVSGLLARDVTVADRVCTHLCGPQDFVSVDRFELSSLPTPVSFQVLSPARLAVLDDTLLSVGRRHPPVLARFLTSAATQAGRVLADQAISQLPHVEDRLLALFWRFADRWGVRRSDDVVVELPLTHEALGRLIGARRPTVSLGLRRLADDGRVVRSGTSWVVAADSLAGLGGRPPAPRRPKPKVAPVPPPAALPSPHRLAERLAGLREDVAIANERTAAVMARNREIRELVAERRARRVSR